MKALLLLSSLVLMTWVACQPAKQPEATVEGLPDLRLTISEEHMTLLRRKRAEAMQEGILVSRSGDYVPARIVFAEREIPAEVRLKGDWLDHLKGTKWSLRVRLEDQHSILGMQQFSLQRPRTRSYLDEWVFHRLLEREDLLTPAYTFVQVWWNEQYKGIYAWKSIFPKRCWRGTDAGRALF